MQLKKAMGGAWKRSESCVARPLVAVNGEQARRLHADSLNASVGALVKFLCLCYYAPAEFAKLSQEQIRALGPACRPHDAALRATGRMISQGSLSTPDEWRTIRPVNGKPAAVQGALSSAPQQAGAFFIVEAEDIEQATAVAATHAAANVGEELGFAVEIRACEMYEEA